MEQRHHHLARYFARCGYEVIFVERVISRIPSVVELFRALLAKIATSGKSENKSLPNGITLHSSYFMPSTNPIFRIWNYCYWAICWKESQKNCFVYSFVDNPYVIGNIGDEMVAGRISVFDIIHNWWEYPWDNRIHNLNANRCLEIFGKLITDSAAMKKQLKTKAPIKEIYLMLPGVSKVWFPQSTNNETLPGKLKVTFFGNLRLNSDVDLIQEFIDDSRYEVNIFGLVDKSISFRKNEINFHGVQSPKLVADFCSHSDIVLLPYNSDKFSSTISPAKFFECLATGALLVSRADLSHLPGWNSYVHSVIAYEDIHESISRALEIHSTRSSEQVAFAKQHSWDNRFNQLARYIFT